MALKGIKVIEFAGLAPGPFCGKILRDLGARVILIDKVKMTKPIEKFMTFGLETTVDRLSHDKESIAINLKHKKGIEIVKKLSINADVLIDPYRKGVLERLDLGPTSIFSLNPRLIYARLTGYGQHGELSERAGHDINYLSYSGVLSALGREHEKPYPPINLIADFGGGGLMCALAIVTSLFERSQKNTLNKVIDMSMVEGAAYMSSWLWASQDIPGVWEGPRRGTNLLDGGYHAYDTYKTKDGKFMAVGALEPQFHEELMNKLNLKGTNDLAKELEDVFATKTQSEWSEIFKNSDACVSPVLELHEAPKNAHSKERNSFVQLDVNKFLPDMSWLELNKSKREFKIPKPGGHTVSILEQDVGLNRDEIEQLFEENVVSKSESNSKIKSKL